MRVKFFALAILATAFTFATYAAPTDPVKPKHKAKAKATTEAKADPGKKTVAKKFDFVVVLYFHEGIGWTREDHGLSCQGDNKFCKMTIRRQDNGNITVSDGALVNALQQSGYDPAIDAPGDLTQFTINSVVYVVTIEERD